MRLQASIPPRLCGMEGRRTSVRVMPDLVDAIREEIDARLEELRPLAREASDLQRAFEALSEVPAAPTGDGRGRRRRSNQRVSSRSRSSPGNTRAPLSNSWLPTPARPRCRPPRCMWAFCWRTCARPP